MRVVHKRYLREILPAMAVYVVVLFVSVNLMPKLASPGWRTAVALLPMAPIILAIRAMVRVIRDQDELERRIDLEAIALGSAATGIGFFAYGLLLNAASVPAVPVGALTFWVLPSLFGGFGLSKCLLVRRYRLA